MIILAGPTVLSAVVACPLHVLWDAIIKTRVTDGFVDLNQQWLS